MNTKILLQHYENFTGLKILIIGVHRMNEKFIKYLQEKGASLIFIANRTFEKAQELAQKYNCQALHFKPLDPLYQENLYH